MKRIWFTVSPLCRGCDSRTTPERVLDYLNRQSQAMAGAVRLRESLWARLASSIVEREASS